MRAALRLFEDILPPEASSLDDELKWVAGQLGPVRDLDVQVRRLQDSAVELGLSQALVAYGAWLEEQRQRALTALNDASQSVRFQELTERLEHLDALAARLGTDRPLQSDLPVRLKRAFRKLRR